MLKRYADMQAADSGEEGYSSEAEEDDVPNSEDERFIVADSEDSEEEEEAEETEEEEGEASMGGAGSDGDEEEVRQQQAKPAKPRQAPRGRGSARKRQRVGASKARTGHSGRETAAATPYRQTTLLAASPRREVQQRSAGTRGLAREQVAQAGQDEDAEMQALLSYFHRTPQWKGQWRIVVPAYSTLDALFSAFVLPDVKQIVLHLDVDDAERACTTGCGGGLGMRGFDMDPSLVVQGCVNCVVQQHADAEDDGGTRGGSLYAMDRDALHKALKVFSPSSKDSAVCLVSTDTEYILRELVSGARGGMRIGAEHVFVKVDQYRGIVDDVKRISEEMKQLRVQHQQLMELDALQRYWKSLGEVNASRMQVAYSVAEVPPEALPRRLATSGPLQVHRLTFLAHNNGPLVKYPATLWYRVLQEGGGGGAAGAAATKLVPLSEEDSDDAELAALEEDETLEWTVTWNFSFHTERLKRFLGVLKGAHIIVRLMAGGGIRFEVDDEDEAASQAADVSMFGLFIPLMQENDDVGTV